MKLKRLELTGFKSFNEKASIDFPTGISAIVGPNGCGKSNVIDAIRWVMGEQSVKQLRGKSMDDVIFSGANGHPPLNMAEVSLTLLNDNGSAPEELKDYSEIMLTRRVFRSGERAYFINKQPCRLKDIYNIFYGSGMGPKSYAVIQQGNIGTITDADPQERRYFVEEAAGITRYKNRKKEALRKVEKTNQNLLRLNDIILEIKRQMSGLKRQAKKAERYKRYQEKIRKLDALLSIKTYDRFEQKIEETETLLTQLKDEDLGHASQLKKLDAAIEEIKFEREKKNQEITSQRSEIFENQRGIDRMENNLAHLRESITRISDEIASLEDARRDLEEKNTGIDREIDQAKHQNVIFKEEIQKVKAELDQKRTAFQQLEQKLESLTEQQETEKADLMDLVAQEARFKNIFQNASNNKDSINRRLKRICEDEALAERQIDKLDSKKVETSQELDRIRQQAEDLDNQVGKTKLHLNDLSGKLSQQIKCVQTMELNRNKLLSKHSALKKMEENFEWYRDGVKAIMKDWNPAGDRKEQDAAKIFGLMADIIEPTPAFETAVDAVLGESLQYIIVNDQSTGTAAIDYLQSQSAGRSGFIPIHSIKTVTASSSDATGDGDRLLNHVTVKPGFESIAEAVLGHVFIAPNIKKALEIFNRNGKIRTIVTQNGDVVTHQGIMIGGSQDKLSGILSKKNEIKRLEKEISGLEKDLDVEKDKQKGLESELREAESGLQKLMEELGHLAQDEIEVEKSLYKITEDLKHSRRHLEIIQLEHEQLRGEASDLEAEMARYNQAVADIEAQIKSAQVKVTETGQQIQIVTSQKDALNQKVVDLQLNMTTANAKLENSSHTLRRLEAYRQDARERFQQLSSDIQAKKQKVSEARHQITEDESRLAGFYETIQRLNQSLETNETAYQAIDASLKNNDEIVSELQSKRESVLQKIRFLEIDLSEQRIKRDNIAKRLEDQYLTTLMDFRNELAADAENAASAQPDSPEEIEEALNRYRNLASKITDVNLSAIKEFESFKERSDFLIEQREDLVAAIDDLHKVIRKINRITQKKFMDTFTAINAKLAEVFPSLFEGGSAKLMLTEPDKPLESGVEFMVHPPGKKLTRLSLLSGGEKALSAIAFLFSIFLLKPASFCLLDEIDAPLDEANIFRFNNLLRLIGGQSQVVMITHNKRSMEFADTLFGITMEQLGISKIVSVDLKRN